MSTFEGEQLVADGIALALDATPVLSREKALEVIFLCALQCEHLDGDTVHQYLKDHDLPNLERGAAWGGLWRAARVKGWIEPVTDSSRWRKSGRKSQHAKPMQLYHSLVAGEF